MAQRPKFRKTNTFVPRLLSALSLGALALWFIYDGPPYVFLFAGPIAIGLFIEWGLLCLKNRLTIWPRFLVILLGTFYLAIAILWLLNLLSQPGSWKLCYWLLFLVWSTDTAAYFGGKLLGGPKLIPSISPNKTWSGFVVGLLGGTAVAYILSFWLLPSTFHIWQIGLLVVVAQVGDLVESQAKRWSDVKDSGMLIPGHGGLLDRLDSLLAISFALALWQWPILMNTKNVYIPHSSFVFGANAPTLRTNGINDSTVPFVLSVGSSKGPKSKDEFTLTGS